MRQSRCGRCARMLAGFDRMSSAGLWLADNSGSHKLALNSGRLGVLNATSTAHGVCRELEKRFAQLS